MAKLNSIEKQTNNKFLNLYKANFTNENTGKDFDYFIASRKEEDKLTCKTKDHSKADAVMMFCVDYGKEVIYLIKQFRPAINDYILESPAGLVDPGEEIVDTVYREIYEETGLTAIEYTTITPVCYTSEGMSDESLQIFEVSVTGEPCLDNKEENEDIEVMAFKIDEIPDIIKGKHGIVSIKTYLMLQSLYLRAMMNK